MYCGSVNSSLHFICIIQNNPLHILKKLLFAPFKLQIQSMFSSAICLVLMQLRKCCQFHVISNRNYLCSYSDRIYEAYANIITLAPLMTLTKPFY